MTILMRTGADVKNRYSDVRKRGVVAISWVLGTAQPQLEGRPGGRPREQVLQLLGRFVSGDPQLVVAEDDPTMSKFTIATVSLIGKMGSLET